MILTNLTADQSEALSVLLAEVRPAQRTLGALVDIDLSSGRWTLRGTSSALAALSAPRPAPSPYLHTGLDLVDTRDLEAPGLDALAGVLAGTAALEEPEDDTAALVRRVVEEVEQEEGGARPAPSNDDQEGNALASHDIPAAEGGDQEQDEIATPAASEEAAEPAFTEAVAELVDAVAPAPSAPTRGTITDEDRAEILRLSAEGQDARSIGQKLGLRTNVVGTVLHHAKRRTAMVEPIAETGSLSGAGAEAHDQTSARTGERRSPQTFHEPLGPVLEGVPAPAPAAVSACSTAAAGVPARVAPRPAPRPVSPVALVTDAICEVRGEREAVGFDRAPAPSKATTASDLRRTIAAHLDALGHEDGWTPARDRDLAGMLCAGTWTVSGVAERLGVSAAAATERFLALCAPIRERVWINRNGKGVRREVNNTAGQEVLLALLRERAAPVGVAAE